MSTKTIVRVFRDVRTCEEFLNSFPENTVKKSRITPFQDEGYACFLAFLEVEEQKSNPAKV